MVTTTPKTQDIIAMGLAAARGQLVISSFYDDVSPDARAWSDRYMAKTHKLPTEVQVGVYSAVCHLLQAVSDTGSDDGDTVAAKMRSTPVVDSYTRNGAIRPDGRLVHDMYFMEVITRGKHKPTDHIWRPVATIEPDAAFPPLNASRCPLVKK